MEKVENVVDTINDPTGKFGDALFDTALGDFITFFNDIIVGKQKEDDDNKCLAVIMSNNSIMTAQEAVSEIFNQHSQEIDQDILTTQSITVNCGETPLKGYQLEKEYEYNIFGMKEGDGCIKYGCCYDINQTATSKISAINEDITQKTEKMFNSITSSIKNDVNIK